MVELFGQLQGNNVTAVSRQIRIDFKTNNRGIGYCNLFNYASYRCEITIAYTSQLLFKFPVMLKKWVKMLLQCQSRHFITLLITLLLYWVLLGYIFNQVHILLHFQVLLYFQEIIKVHYGTTRRLA